MIVSSCLESRAIKYQFHIYSLGNVEDFAFLNHLQPVWHVNEGEFLTMVDLVSADILIMAKSSFSYIAGILSRGIVLYEPFWHNGLKRWINMSRGADYITKKIFAIYANKASHQNVMIK